VKGFQTTAAAAVLVAFSLSACGGGGGSSSGGPSIVPPVAQAPNPGPSPVQQSAACPSTGPSASSVASAGTAQSSKRSLNVDTGTNLYVPGVITVTYASDGAARSIDDAAAAMDARPTASLHLDAVGVKARVLSVDPSRVSEIVARLPVRSRSTERAASS